MPLAFKWRGRVSTCGELNRLRLALLAFSPVATLIGLGFYLYHQGLHYGDLLSFWFMTSFTGLSVTAGYHRYYSHRSYECHPVLQVFYLLFGAATIQNSALQWASNHTYHHRFVDREGDPHNIRKGVFWTYMGWLLYKDRFDRSFENVLDLKTHLLVVWQHYYYFPVGIVIGFGLPFLIGLSFGRPWGSFLWGGLLRIVLLHHIAFLGNVVGHFIGPQPYSNRNSSRDNWWLSFLTFGEGYHNFHHTFPCDYRSGIAWYHWDPTKWWIWSLSLFGLTWGLNRTPEKAMLKARTRIEYTRSSFS